jgi:hypothetical protein
MNATRVIKTVESTDVDELARYMGRQVEIIIFPLSDEAQETAAQDRAARQTQFFEIIEQCAGTVQPWTREELHER